MMNAPPPLPQAALSWPVRQDASGAQHLRLKNYSVVYYPRSAESLVITFDPRMKTYPDSETRDPWAMAFLERHNVSALQVKPDDSCWYRQPELEDLFRALSEDGFFSRFPLVMTYGGSMGGFGALAFAGLSGARRVLSINPQINLGPTVRDWEDRYFFANDYNWDGPLCDIGAQLKQVEMPVLCYDPYHMVDRRQVDLISDTPQAVHLHVPFVGHRMPGHLHSMRLLAPLFRQVLHNTLDVGGFYRLARRRRTLMRYREMMLFKSRNNPVRHERLLRLLPPMTDLIGTPSQNVIDDEE